MSNYDVALSFAGEQRSYVDEVNSELRAYGVTTFYDDDSKVDLWGKDLTEALTKIYSENAKWVVMFISQEYISKIWTNVERRAALSRAINEKTEYILPVRFDDTLVPGMPSTVAYISLKNVSPAELARLICLKIGHRWPVGYVEMDPTGGLEELQVRSLRPDDIIIREQRQNSFIWRDDDDYPIRISDELWERVIKYVTALSDNVIAAGITKQSLQAAQTDIENAALRSSQNSRLQRWFYRTAVSAFNAQLEDHRMQTETAKIADPTAELVASLASHNIQYRTKAESHSGVKQWRFVIQDQNSTRCIDFMVPPGSTEQEIIAEALKQTSGNGPWVVPGLDHFLRT